MRPLHGIRPQAAVVVAGFFRLAGATLAAAPLALPRARGAPPNPIAIF